VRDELHGLIVVTRWRIYWSSSREPYIGLSVMLGKVHGVARDGAVLELVWDAGRARFAIEPEGAAEALERAIRERI
jgi:hypothetical protein